MGAHDFSVLKPLWRNLKEKLNIPEKSISNRYKNHENSYAQFGLLDVVFLGLIGIEGLVENVGPNVMMGNMSAPVAKGYSREDLVKRVSSGINPAVYDAYYE